MINSHPGRRNLLHELQSRLLKISKANPSPRQAVGGGGGASVGIRGQIPQKLKTNRKSANCFLFYMYAPRFSAIKCAI